MLKSSEEGSGRGIAFCKFKTRRGRKSGSQKLRLGKEEEEEIENAGKVKYGEIQEEGISPVGVDRIRPSDSAALEKDVLQTEFLLQAKNHFTLCYRSPLSTLLLYCVQLSRLALEEVSGLRRMDDQQRHGFPWEKLFFPPFLLLLLLFSLSSSPLIPFLLHQRERDH